MVFPTHILVGIDGSPHSRAAWHFALELARCFGGRLTAMHVVVVTPVWSSFDRSALGAEAAEQAARAYGQHLLDEARSLAGDEIETVLRFGPPAEAICQRAVDSSADLIVLGSRGLGTLERLVMGSVSSAVVRQAPCSVLVVRGEHTSGATWSPPPGPPP
ncbi:MAG: universal stress protein [Chloroflexota bacterium]|nr:universal stress protein [Chloroflexota bacterium]